MEVGQVKAIKEDSPLKYGVDHYGSLTILNLNPLVILWQPVGAVISSYWDKEKWMKEVYRDRFPNELKEMFPFSALHPLSFENMFGNNLPADLCPVTFERSIYLDYFKKGEQLNGEYWLENSTTTPYVAYTSYLEKNDKRIVKGLAMAFWFD